MEWWFLIFIAVGAVEEIVLHALSHAVVVWGEGKKVLTFKPWPHKHKAGWSWGRMTYDRHLEYLGGMCNAAPMLKGMLMALLWLNFAQHWWHLWPMVAWEAWDVIFWWRGWFWGSDRADGRKLRNAVEALKGK